MHREPLNINLKQDSVHLCMWSSSAEKDMEVLIDRELNVSQSVLGSKGGQQA